MRASSTSLTRRMLLVAVSLATVLGAALVLALSSGSGGEGLMRSLAVVLGQGEPNPVLETIVWRIRLPRALLAALAGGALSLGGLVFQALLRNPLAEPYILGIAGGSVTTGSVTTPGVAVMMMTTGSWGSASFLRPQAEIKTKIKIARKNRGIKPLFFILHSPWLDSG